MKYFEDIDLNIALCRQELDDLKQHLDNKNELRERRDVLPFFRERRTYQRLLARIFHTSISLIKLLMNMTFSVTLKQI